MLKFMIFSDLHYDQAPDGNQRVEEILKKTRVRNPDFIVSLGDLCEPGTENRHVLDSFRTLGIPFYQCIGNHETDHCTTEQILEFSGQNKLFHSVILKDYKLLFLNTCYLRVQECELPFFGKNFRHLSCEYPILPQQELQWLKEELSEGRRTIVFSHHSLVNSFRNRGVANREVIREIFRKNQVLLCLNGHDHGDDFACVEGIPYITINSANYAWLGSQISSSEELLCKYGHLRGMLQYEQAMCAYIEIDDHEIRIFGEEGRYLSVTPDDIGLHDYRWNGVSVKPRISSWCIPIKSG